MKHTWLYAGRMAVLAVGVACTSLGAQQTGGATSQVARTGTRPPDVVSPQAVVTALYDVITGPAARPDRVGFSFFNAAGGTIFASGARPAAGHPAHAPRILQLPTT